MLLVEDANTCLVLACGMFFKTHLLATEDRIIAFAAFITKIRSRRREDGRKAVGKDVSVTGK
jgi:hypothetical protein